MEVIRVLKWVGNPHRRRGFVTSQSHYWCCVCVSVEGEREKKRDEEVREKGVSS